MADDYGLRLEDQARFGSWIAFNLIDGLIRMVFFVIMIFSMSYLKDIRRVFEYHGAEHKTVFTWEKGLDLTPENATNAKPSASAMRHVVSDGRDAGRDRAVFGDQLRSDVAEPGRSNRFDAARRRTFV